MTDSGRNMHRILQEHGLESSSLTGVRTRYRLGWLHKDRKELTGIEIGKKLEV